MGASEAMTIWLTFGTNCDYFSGLSPTLATLPRQYVFPFSSWNGTASYNCIDPIGPRPGEYLDKIVLFPSAPAGELRVYGISFSYD